LTFITSYANNNEKYKTKMIDTDTPSPRTHSLEKEEGGSFAEMDSKLDQLAVRYPEVLDVAEALRQATLEARRAFGLSGEPRQRGDESLIREVTATKDGYSPRTPLAWLKESQRDLSDEETRNNDISYFMDGIANDVYNEAYDTLPEGVDVNALSESFLKYVLPSLSQKLETAVPAGFRQRLLEAAVDNDVTESQEKESTQIFVPKSDLISPSGIRSIGEGSLDTAAVFSYRSSEGDASEREAMNRQSRSAVAYGESLRNIIEGQGSETVYRAVETAGTIATNALSQYKIEPSSWTRDGAWALWDMGKRMYFADHPDVQQTYIHTELDKQMYSEPLDFNEPDKIAGHLAERQMGWEVIQGPQSMWCIEVLGSLLDHNKGIDAALKAKVEAKRKGEQVHFKSSELSLVGRLLLGNLEH
jgi:hypothetical protein